MITIYLEDSDYRHILFPNYRTYTGKLASTDDLVYIKQGEEDLQTYLKCMEDLNMHGVYEIVMPSVAQYTLDTPESVFEFMVEYFKFEDSDSIRSRFRNLMEEDKKEFIKLSKACGDWYRPIFRQTIRAYKLLEAMAMDKHAMLSTWYKLTESFSIPRLWASFLTFSCKVYQFDSLEGGLPRWYRDTLKRVNTRHVKFEYGLSLLQNAKNLPYEVLIPRILLAMRGRNDR